MNEREERGEKLLALSARIVFSDFLLSFLLSSPHPFSMITLGLQKN